MNKPPLWVRAPYYLIGTRVPERYREWVEHDVARPRWHRIVPRLRLWVPGLVVAWSWWAVAGRDGLFLPVAASVVLSGIWLMRPGDGAHDRAQELLFQQKKLQGMERVSAYLAFLEAAQPNPEDVGRFSPEPAFDHEAWPDHSQEDGMSAPCATCGQTIQREGERWAHRDHDWLLYSCPACGWQDASAGRCPDCGQAELARYEREAAPAPRRVSAFRVYVALLVIGVAIVLLADDRSPLARLLR